MSDNVALGDKVVEDTNGGLVKVEDVGDTAPVTPDGNEDNKAEKTSPRKRGAADKDDATTPKKKRSPAKGKDREFKADEDGFGSPQTARKRKTSGTPAAPGRPIPASFEAADEADRMLVKMKDDGNSWPEIKAAWTKATGEIPGSSTLPNRYNRLKTNFMEFTENDEQQLLAAKVEVEMKIAAEKFSRIADAMEAKGCKKFSSLFIQKKLKEIEKKVQPATASY